MPRILEFSRKISIFIAEKISLCEGEKEKDLARKTVNSNKTTNAPVFTSGLIND